MSKGKPRVTWDPRQGPLMGAYNAAAALAAVTAANHGFDLGISPWWAAGIAAAGGVASHVDARARRLGPVHAAYRAGCWLAAGSWTFYALGAGPWDVNTLLAGGLLAGVGAILAPAVAAHDQQAAVRKAEEEDEEKVQNLAQAWERRLLRVCKVKGAQVVGIEDWMRPDPDHPGAQRQTGYTVEVDLPSGGVSWETIAKHKKGLANDLDLPEGCSVDAGPGTSRRKVLIEVSTVNVLGGDIGLPENPRLPATINDDLAVGLHSDGSLVEFPLRWTSGVLVGAKRQGKSNMIKNVARKLLRCDDVVVMGIDPNGGEVFKPFLRPWLEGRTRRPAIDWVATTEDEIRSMLDWLQNAIPVRRSGYSDHMWTNGGDDKLQVSHQIPQIVLLTDESKSLPVGVKRALVQINDRGGAASISMLTSWLRAVANANEGLPRDLLVQSETAVSMRVNEDTELKRLFGFSAKVPPAGEAPAPGWGHFVAYSGEVPRLYKAARSTNEDAYAEALATDGWRPLIDDLTVDGAGREVYEQRWERAKADGWLGSAQVPEAPQRTSGEPAPARPDRPERPSREEAAERSADIKDRLRRARGEPSGDVDSEFHRLMEAEFADMDRMDAPQPQVPPFLTAVLAVFDSERTEKVWRSVLAEALTGGDSDRITALLGSLGVQPLPNSFRMPGRDGTGRGFAATDVEAAVDAIQQGRIRVPPEVARWSRGA